MTSAHAQINALCEDIEPYAGRPQPKSQADADTLLADPAAYLSRKAQRTKAFSEELKTSIPQACGAWEEIEVRLLHRLGQSRAEFLAFFDELVEKVGEDGTLPEDQAEKDWDMRLRALVTNIGWLETFSYLIPAGAPEFAEPARRAGRMMSAVFALEKIGRHTHRGTTGFDRTLPKILACYAQCKKTEEVRG